MAKGLQQNQDGKGTTKLVTPEEHAANRAAAKARKQRNRGTSGKTAFGIGNGRQPLFDEIAADHRKKSEVVREAEQVAFRGNQARIARVHMLGRFDPGTPAAIMAEKVLEIFPTVKPMEGESRTKAARRETENSLSAETLKRPKAVDLGARIASRALFDAYDQLKKS